MAGKLMKITRDSTWVVDPPLHEGTHSFPLVNPKTCPGAQFEFGITEFRPGVGRALDDLHPNEDHVFYVLSGKGNFTVAGEVHSVEPGDALWVPKGTVHSFEHVGGETCRLAVVFAPARPIWA